MRLRSLIDPKKRKAWKEAFRRRDPKIFRRRGVVQWKAEEREKLRRMLISFKSATRSSYVTLLDVAKRTERVDPKSIRFEFNVLFQRIKAMEKEIGIPGSDLSILKKSFVAIHKAADRYISMIIEKGNFQE
jgi:hypothetical protein